MVIFQKTKKTTTMMTTIVGVDYSLSCPCICISNTVNFNENYFYFLSDVKRHHGKVMNITGDPHRDYHTDQERYENIASWMINIIKPLPDPDILIEDYAFAAKGRVFNLAENCGLLKYLLYKDGYRFSTVAPSVIKKFATGKGNANKQAMYDAFYVLLGIDLIKIYGSKAMKLDSPVTDIVDAYYLTRYMHDSIATNNKEKLNRGTNKNN
jgi:Holliday junction resolvasome RuvABC endonuclease subunit